MAITINGIVCQEEVNQYTEAADWDRGPNAVKGFLCAWGDRFTVANGLLGLASTTSVGGTITLNLPMQHPEISGIFVREIWIEGKGPFYQGAKQLAFANAVVYARYGCIPWSFEGLNYGNIDPATPLVYAKQNIRTSIETKTIPARKAVWKNAPPGGSANDPTGNPYSFPVCVIEMEITFMHVPYLPAQQIITASVNPLNSTTFLNCAPGFVYFLGMDSETTFDTAGTFDQNLRYSFKYRPVAEWDKDWDGGAWNVVLNKSGGVPFLGRSDLNSLIASAYRA